MENLKLKYKIILGVIIGIMVIVIIVYFFNKNFGGEISYIKEEELIQNNIDEETTSAEEIKLKKEKIKIHIAGEVINEGLIEINKGDRIQDAINIAGGASEEANLEKVNLAYILSDGQKIYIPNIYEGEQEVLQDNVEGIIIQEEEGTIMKKININNANQKDLQNIPGVGEATALKIISYRETYGKFNEIDEIKNVSGIGEAKFNNMKDFICT